MLAVLGVSYASSARAWLQQRSDINTLNAQIATSQAQIAALDEAKQRWHDSAYIRTQARERFGWLMPGETGFRVIDSHGHVVSSGSSLSQPRAGARRRDGEWWQRAWDSVVAAGVGPAGGAKHRSGTSAPGSIGKVPHYRLPPHMDRKGWLLPETASGQAGR